MGLVVVVLVLALALGLARGGRIKALGHVELGGVRTLVTAGLLQAAAVLAPERAGAALYVASAALACLVVARNVELPGMPLVGLGLLLNLAVVVANAAMPVSLHAAQRAGVSTVDLRAGKQPGHEPADRRTRLALLADVVPVACPLHREVVSAGDVGVAAGLGLYVVVALGRRPRRRDRQRHRPPRRVARWTTRVRDSTTRGSYS